MKTKIGIKYFVKCIVFAALVNIAFYLWSPIYFLGWGSTEQGIFCIGLGVTAAWAVPLYFIVKGCTEKPWLYSILSLVFGLALNYLLFFGVTGIIDIITDLGEWSALTTLLIRPVSDIFFVCVTLFDLVLAIFKKSLALR